MLRRGSPNVNSMLSAPRRDFEDGGEFGHATQFREGRLFLEPLSELAGFFSLRFGAAQRLQRALAVTIQSSGHCQIAQGPDGTRIGIASQLEIISCNCGLLLI